MRIFTKKSFKFRLGSESVTTKALSFADVPEWVEKDPIFALALKDKAIEIVDSKADEKRVEADAFTPADADTSAGADAATDAEANKATVLDANTSAEAQEEAKTEESTSKKKTK